MTSRQRPVLLHRNVRAAAVSSLLAATMALSGCTFLSADTASPDPAPETGIAAPVEKSSTEPTEAPVPEPVPLTAAEAFSKKLSTSLTSLAASTKAPNREQMRAAMLKAGAVEETLEISVDITPTGLAVDAIEAASPIADECVIGQVRNGKVAVTVLPVLPSGRCFVGDVH